MDRQARRIRPLDIGACLTPEWADAPPSIRPDALQSVTVLESLESLTAQHGAAGVPFKELETATRSRLDYRALTDALKLWSTTARSGG